MAKTFKGATGKKREPTDEEIEAFESGGPGTDQPEEKPDNSVKAGKAANDAPEPTKRLSLDLPQSVHRRFRTACSAADTKMAREIMNFIERRTRQLEEKAGISRK